MSGNSALAAAKRRRVGVTTPESRQAPPPPPPPPVQTRQSAQPSRQTANRPPARAVAPPPQPMEEEDNTDSEFTSVFASIPQIPMPPANVNPIQVLAVHHQFINRITAEFPNALDTLGNHFNALSSNCDILNDRLVALENGSGSGSSSSTKSSSADLDAVKSQMTQFQKDLDELKTMVLKVQGMTVDVNYNLMKLLSDVEKCKEEIKLCKESSAVVTDSYVLPKRVEFNDDVDVQNEEEVDAVEEEQDDDEEVADV
jgi:hypothetical protein